jgi:hypothetical protein
MSEETKEFCAENGPFKAVERVVAGGLSCAVRDRTGYNIAYCDDEDAANAIAEALNAAKGD